MQSRDLPRLGEVLRNQRMARGISFSQLEELSRVERSNIHRLETAGVKKPRPDHLGRLAEALDLPIADLYGLAGLPFPTRLPSFSPYLRSRYTGLPDSARVELEKAFTQIAQRHGYDPGGPLPGQDEN